MENKEGVAIHRVLLEVITFFAKALPARLLPESIELLVGALITQAGFVTETWLVIKPERK